jgi:hypothetical protein
MDSKGEVFYEIVEILRMMGLKDAEVYEWAFSPQNAFNGDTVVNLVNKGEGEMVFNRLMALAQGNLGS